MNLLISIFIVFASLTTFATPIGADLDSTVVENPTFQGKPFCGALSPSINSVYVCNSLGYSTAIVTQSFAYDVAIQCWEVNVVGSSHSLKLQNDARTVLAKVQCLRPKAPSAGPIKPSPLPDLPLDPKP